MCMRGTFGVALVMCLAKEWPHRQKWYGLVLHVYRTSCGVTLHSCANRGRWTAGVVGMEGTKGMGGVGVVRGSGGV